MIWGGSHLIQDFLSFLLRCLRPLLLSAFVPSLLSPLSLPCPSSISSIFRSKLYLSFSSLVRVRRIASFRVKSLFRSIRLYLYYRRSCPFILIALYARNSTLAGGIPFDHRASVPSLESRSATLSISFGNGSPGFEKPDL